MVASSCVKVFNRVVIVGQSKLFHEPDDRVSNNLQLYSNLSSFRPERQQAVALWWKSKPAFKKFGRMAFPQQLKDLDSGKLRNRGMLHK